MFFGDFCNFCKGSDVTNGLRLLFLPPKTEALYNNAWSSFNAGT
jgi:hypothetical protein